MKDLRELLEHELKDIYSAEKQITAALPKVIDAANDTRLKSRLQTHLTETEGQIGRLESIFSSMGINPGNKHCKAMEGLIAESEMRDHPMRNFVECCLGGDAPLPDMSVTARNKLEPGDMLLVCTDGLWSGLEDEDFGNASREGRTPVDFVVRALAERAVATNAPHSDNTSIAAVRWHGA